MSCHYTGMGNILNHIGDMGRRMAESSLHYYDFGKTKYSLTTSFNPTSRRKKPPNTKQDERSPTSRRKKPKTKDNEKSPQTQNKTKKANHPTKKTHRHKTRRKKPPNTKQDQRSPTSRRKKTKTKD